jgi:alginate O-acetyltransferase complex protein AlgI
MNFISWSFVALFAVVFAARLLIGRRKTERSFVWFTIVASTIFVMWHVPVYILILLTTVTVDYTAARIIDRAPPKWPWRKAVLGISLACNLLLLGFFKYADFSITMMERSLNSMGLGVQLPRLGLILPIGISFYTFGSMSYTIDVYRRRLRAIRRFQDFYYFVTFFPHMVAGPIVRAGQFFYQFSRPRRPRLVVFNRAAFLIIRGVFLKMVCADNIGRVVSIYWPYGAPRGGIGTPFAGQGYSGDLILLALLFSAQIFCDFEGYTSIARGLAYLLGYRFPINFRYPYIAGSFNDFWQRWHITLSSWLRDYLYVPLCGDLKRRTPLPRAYGSIFLVMLLAGLWHGAAATFVCWGAIHGVALVIERILGFDPPPRHFGLRPAWRLVVQSVAVFALIFFRSASVSGALGFIHNIGDLRFGAINGDIATACMFLVPPFVMHLHGFLEERASVPPLSRLEQAVLAGAMLFAVVSIHGDSSEFLYFQF